MKVLTLKVLNIPKEAQKDFPLEADEIGMNSQMYRNLFGRTFGDGDGGRPWRKGILCVSTQPKFPERKRLVRLRFRGVNFTGLDTQSCCLPIEAIQQLGLKPSEAPQGKTQQVRVRPSIPVLGHTCFYWNHPSHSARVAFKLGLVAMFIALLPIVQVLLGDLIP
jgi:hypothetical protein